MRAVILLVAVLAALAGAAQARAYGARGFASAEPQPSQAPSSAAKAPWAAALAVPKDQYLHVEVDVGQAKPEQVSVVLRAKADASRVVVLAAAAAAGGRRVASFDTSSQRLANALGGPGAVEVSVVVAGGEGVQAESWKAGEASLDGLPEPKLGKAARRAAEWTAELPEIDHVFPPEARRPNALMSLIFTGAAFVPMAGLLFGLQQLGLKVSVPGGAPGFLAAALFQGAVAFLLALIVIYWLGLNIFQALAAVGLTSVVTIVFGQRALRIHAEARAKEAADEAAAAPAAKKDN